MRSWLQFVPAQEVQSGPSCVWMSSVLRWFVPQARQCKCWSSLCFMLLQWLWPGCCVGKGYSEDTFLDFD